MPAIVIDDKIIRFTLADGVITVGDNEIKYEILKEQGGRLLVRVGDAIREITYVENGGDIELSAGGRHSKFKVLSDRDLLLREFQSQQSAHSPHSQVKAPMPGLVVKVLVKKGDRIKRGSTLAILEAMKMENEIRGMQDAEVADVAVKDGDVVEKDQVLLTLQ